MQMQRGIALSLGYQPVTAMRVAVAAAVLAGHLEREFDRRALPDHPA